MINYWSRALARHTRAVRKVLALLAVLPRDTLNADQRVALQAWVQGIAVRMWALQPGAPVLNWTAIDPEDIADAVWTVRDAFRRRSTMQFAVVSSVDGQAFVHGRYEHRDVAQHVQREVWRCAKSLARIGLPTDVSLAPPRIVEVLP